MIDHRLRIGLAQHHAGILQHQLRGFPRFVDEGCGQTFQLRHPAADIGPIGVELLALQNRIEDAEIGRCIRPAACHPLPARRIGADVGIHQRVPEPGLSALPGHQQVLDQKRGGDHAHPVVHPARCPQFAHAGINDRVAGIASLPCLERVIVFAPRKVRELGPEGLAHQVRPVVQQVIGELPPQQFLQKVFCATVHIAAAVGHGVAGGVPALERGDFSEVQMRRQARGGKKVRPVAVVLVIAHGLGNEAFELVARTGFARRPALAELRCPMRLGFIQLPVRDIVLCNAAKPELQVLRYRTRLTKRLGGEAGLRKRGIDLVGVARAGADVFGVVQQVTGKPFALDTNILAQG